jgi:putative ABC transport system ATP-binding protein
VGFVFLTYRFLEPIAEFTEVIDQTQNAVSGLRRVLSVLDTPVGPPAPLNPLPLPNGVLSIDLDRVCFAYSARDGDDEDDLVLNDVSLHIHGGQHVALVGPSGSGKTTVARLIARLVDPTIGSVSIGGVPLTQVGNEVLRSRMVVVPQEPFLFAQTVRENLMFALPAASDDLLLASFKDLDLLDWLETMPFGLDTHVGQRGGSLSAGERQLIALVRASLVKPDVLILDEATSAVDAATEVRISRALQRLAEGRTTVSIAHRLSTAARAQRVVLLRDGRVVEDGSHQDLLKNDGEYAKLYATWVSATEGQR